MRIIVAGSRDFNDKALFRDKMDEILAKFSDIEIISGHARGADTMAEEYAVEKGLMLTIMPADWKKYGRAAGPIRNSQMLDYACDGEPLLIAFWDGVSRGTANMIVKAKEKGVACVVVEYMELQKNSGI